MVRIVLSGTPLALVFRSSLAQDASRGVSSAAVAGWSEFVSRGSLRVSTLAQHGAREVFPHRTFHGGVVDTSSGGTAAACEVT